MPKLEVAVKFYQPEKSLLTSMDTRALTIHREIQAMISADSEVTLDKSMGPNQMQSHIQNIIIQLEKLDEESKKLVTFKDMLAKGECVQ